MNLNGTTPSDERIDRVLGGLRSAEPPQGMEQRISTALLRQASATADQPSGSTWLSIARVAGVAACVVALVSAVSFHFYARKLPAHDSPMASRTDDSPTPESQRQLPDVEAVALPEQSWKSGRAPVRHALSPLAPAPRRTANAAAEDQDFPAPPLPLTEQERLLIRMVHHDSPVQLALLSPAAREAELQRDREQVQEFFKGPPMPPANFKLEPYPVPEGAQ